MSIKKIALAGGVAASLMAGTAYASVIDRPFFQVLGVVVVWGADDAATAAPVVLCCSPLLQAVRVLTLSVVKT